MIVSIAAVIAFLLLSAFFSGSETALTGASQAFMLDQEKNEHNPKAKTINRLFKHRDKLIITTLLGSNLFNTMATSLATSVLISLFGSEGVAYATVIMTVLILIYTDMLPKSYSVKHANAVALVVAPMVNFWGCRLFAADLRTPENRQSYFPPVQTSLLGRKQRRRRHFRNPWRNRHV